MIPMNIRCKGQLEHVHEFSYLGSSEDGRTHKKHEQERQWQNLVCLDKIIADKLVSTGGLRREL